MRKFKINHYQIETGQPAEGRRPLRFVLLSDLHGICYGKENGFLLEQIRRQKPDLIVMAGDMVTAGFTGITASTGRLMQVLGEGYPVYYGNGNHESSMRSHRERESRRYYQEYKRFLTSCGIQVLENERILVEIGGWKLAISGLEIGEEYYGRFCYRKLSPGEVAGLIGRPGKGAFNLLIAHNPMGFPAYADWGADLTVSGHLHGGFLRLPVVGGIVSPQMHLFPKYDKGLYVRGKSKMIVSAGIGNHFPPPRIFNPAELVVVELL